VWITSAVPAYPSGALYYPETHGYGFGEVTLNEAREKGAHVAARFAERTGAPQKVSIRRYCDVCGATGRVKGNHKCKACGTNGSTPVETAIYKRLNP
jgi:DnaJ-class molecular chaperone